MVHDIINHVYDEEDETEEPIYENTKQEAIYENTGFGDQRNGINNPAMQPPSDEGRCI